MHAAMNKLVARLSTNIVKSVVVISLTTVAAQAQTAYLLTEGGDTPHGANSGGLHLGTINLTSGAFTPTVDVSLSSAANVLGSFITEGGVFYGAQDGNLYTVNVSTGAETLVGSTGVNPGVFLASTTTGVYGFFGTDLSQLYSVNTSTGHATALGSTGLTATGGANQAFGFSSGGSNLYALYSADDTTTASELYSANTSTGALTAVASTGVLGLNNLTFANGTWYATSDKTGNLYTLNISTGAATLVNSLTGTSGNAIWGFTPVPEMETTLAMALGLAGLAWASRKHLHKHR